METKFLRNSKGILSSLFLVIGIFSGYSFYLQMDMTKKVSSLASEQNAIATLMIDYLSLEELIENRHNGLKKKSQATIDNIRKISSELNIPDELKRYLLTTPDKIEAELNKRRYRSDYLMQTIDSAHIKLEKHNVKYFEVMKLNVDSFLFKQKIAMGLLLLAFTIIAGLSYVLNKLFAISFEKNKKLQEEIEKKNKQLLKSHQKDIISNFSGGMAHEINNSLATILGRSQISTIQSSDNVIKNQMNIINNEVYKIQKLIKQMLISARGICDNIVTVDICKLLTEIVSKSPSHNRIILSLPGEVLLISCSPREIEMVINEIINNAVYFSDEYSPIHVSIERIHKRFVELIGLEVERDYIEIKIDDQGTGIDNTKNIFNPFYTTKEVGHGSGLGLVMVLNFIHAIDGEVIVESKLGEGTSVRLAIPLCEPKPGDQ